jgi:hypothetical protein
MVPDGRFITFLEGSPPTKNFAAWVSIAGASGDNSVRPAYERLFGNRYCFGLDT